MISTKLVICIGIHVKLDRDEDLDTILAVYVKLTD